MRTVKRGICWALLPVCFFLLAAGVVSLVETSGTLVAWLAAVGLVGFGALHVLYGE